MSRSWTVILVLFFIPGSNGQQSYREQSTIDFFGNKNPIFNYMPSPGFVDVERLEQIKQYTDLRKPNSFHVV